MYATKRDMQLWVCAIKRDRLYVEEPQEGTIMWLYETAFQRGLLGSISRTLSSAYSEMTLSVSQILL